MAPKTLEHDDAPLARVPVRTVAAWPVGTFVENLVVREDGSLVVSLFSKKELAQVAPGSEPRKLASLPGSPTGLALVGGAVFVSVGEMGKPGWAIFHMSDSGAVEKIVDVPDALMLNGATFFRSSVLLVADSALGRVFAVDTVTRTVSTWLEDPLLGKVGDDPKVPGVNGVRTFGDHVYFTSTERALVLRAAVHADGSAGKLETVAERLVGDDFALDAKGNLYIATHIFNQIMRLAPDGTRAVVANAEDGIFGSTSAAFGRNASDRGALYVTTTGGIVEPVDGKVREAKILRLEVEKT